jgi:phospholipase/carboxylesterase
MKDIETRQFNGWVHKVRFPSGHPPHPLTIMLHGFTGDEKSMWIFARQVPENHLVLAPRGIYPSPQGGFSWVEERTPPLSPEGAFSGALKALQRLIEAALKDYSQASDKINLLGFSQGAALAFLYALERPGDVTAVAGLSGFLPHGERPNLQQPLAGVPIFLAHGTQDDRIPVERARAAVQALEEAGGDVTYCEDEVGHKLSTTCFRALANFFQQLERNDPAPSP